MVMLSRLGVSTDWSSMDQFFLPSASFFQEQAIFQLFENFLLFDFKNVALWKDATLLHGLSWNFYGQVFDAWFDIIDTRIYFSYPLPISDMFGYEDAMISMTLALTTDRWLTPKILRFGTWAIYFLRSLPVSYQDDDTVEFFYDLFDDIALQWSMTACPLSTQTQNSAL